MNYSPEPFYWLAIICISTLEYKLLNRYNSRNPTVESRLDMAHRVGYLLVFWSNQIHIHGSSFVDVVTRQTSMSYPAQPVNALTVWF